MEIHIIPIITLLCVAVVGSYAALTPELYWKEAFPNVAMPKAIRDSLPNQEYTDNKGTAVNVQKGGVYVSTPGKKGSGPTHVGVSPKGGVGVTTGKPGGGHTKVDVGPKGGVGVSTGSPHKSGSTVGVGKGGVTVRGGSKKKPVYVGVKPGSNPFNYNYAASQTQVHDDPTRALFFLEKDMKLGHKMTIHFTQTTNDAKFLPKDVAQSIPFSSNKMPEILNEFSVQPGSQEAQLIEETIKGCESKGIEGEEKYCATSLNDMTSFAKSTLGKNVKALSTKAKIVDNKGQTYTISGVQKAARDGSVAICHKQNYPFAVFYCHKTTGTTPYDVSLIGENGTKAKAIAVCHKDTSKWNPKHLAFQVLDVKPGRVPICHFLPEDHIVWVRN